MIGAGFSVGVSANLYKDCNRQYGWGLQNGWHWQLPGAMQEDIERLETSRLVKSYWESFAGIPLPTQKIYAYNEGARDYWQIGGALGLLVCGELYIIRGFLFGLSTSQIISILLFTFAVIVTIRDAVKKKNGSEAQPA